MSETQAGATLTFNGLNGATGSYASEPLAAATLARHVVRRRPLTRTAAAAITQRRQTPRPRGQVSPEFGDGSDVGRAGWGIIFPAAADSRTVDAILEALQPLVDLRRTQTEHFRILRGDAGYRWVDGRPETRLNFLRRHKVNVGPVNPRQIPFYLLLVADPQSIPFGFQYEMDVQYLVGRLYFERLEAYAHYAQSVVAAETGQVQLPRRAAFFGTANPGDDATRLSATQLVKPLYDYAVTTAADFDGDWQLDWVPPAQATKESLRRLLGGPATPAFLFTASHGLEWPYGDRNQLPYQGALVCQDWPGPQQHRGPLARDWYLAAEDIAADADLLGLISFHFACYGAGTPYWDDYAIAYDRPRQALAQRAFLAELPKRLLSHPRGGALAVVGHVERAWSYSFAWEDGGSQTQAFEAVLYRLLEGKPVGHALDTMHERHANLASALLAQVQEGRYSPDDQDPNELAFNWIAANDARSYTILGDPAVRMPVVPRDGAAPAAHPALVLTTPRSGDLPPILVPQAALQRNHPSSFSESSAPDTGEISETGESRTEPGDESPDTELPGTGQPPVQGGGAGGTPTRRAVTPLDLLAQLNQTYGAGAPQQFGLKEDIQGALQNVVTSLTTTFETLVGSLANFAKDMTSLEVETYALPNLKTALQAAQESGDQTEALRSQGNLVAWTHIKLDGDLQVAVPTQDGQLKEALWAAHRDMVALAQANRSAMVKVAVETLVSLIGAPKA
jgi:hypothetical protein